MFPLRTHSLPPDARALQEALAESLEEVVQPAAPMVVVEDRNYPALAAIRMTLDNAVAVNRVPPRPAPQTDSLEPALEVERFELRGRPLRVQEAAINLSCEAREVTIYQARDAGGRLLLLLRRAAEGRVELAVPLSDLEALIGSAARAAAAKQGIMLEEVRLIVRTPTNRSLDLEVCLSVRKLFLRTHLRIKGHVEVDEKLDAHLSGLECSGEGTLGTLACGFLDPHLRRFNDRRFSLLVLPLGEIKLRQIHIGADQDLQLSAEFGSESASAA
jgi:hypothetical protein